MVSFGPRRCGLVAYPVLPAVQFIPQPVTLGVRLGDPGLQCQCSNECLAILRVRVMQLTAQLHVFGVRLIQRSPERGNLTLKCLLDDLAAELRVALQPHVVTVCLLPRDNRWVGRLPRRWRQRLVLIERFVLVLHYPLHVTHRDRRQARAPKTAETRPSIAAHKGAARSTPTLLSCRDRAQLRLAAYRSRVLGRLSTGICGSDRQRSTRSSPVGVRQR